MSEGLRSGYKLLGWETSGADAEFFATLAGICSIVTIIVSLALLAVGAIQLLKALDIKVPALDPYAALVAKCEKLTVLVNLALQALSFVCLLIFGLSNSSDYLTLHPAVGAYLLLIFAVLAFVVVKFVVAKLADGAVVANVAVDAKPTHVCSQCGAKANATDKFCANCGGAVVENQVDAE